MPGVPHEQESAPTAPATTPTEWTFLTNHSHVLIFLNSRPEATQREVAAGVGITERAVQRILGELESAGAITRERSGRRNNYHVNPALPLRHPLESHRTIGDLLDAVRLGTARPGKP